MIEILKVNANTYDVFCGKGWENWSRFRVEKRKLIFVKGDSLSKENYKTICERLL